MLSIREISFLRKIKCVLFTPVAKQNYNCCLSLNLKSALSLLDICLFKKLKCLFSMWINSWKHSSFLAIPSKLGASMFKGTLEASPGDTA